MKKNKKNLYILLIIVTSLLSIPSFFIGKIYGVKEYKKSYEYAKDVNYWYNEGIGYTARFVHDKMEELSKDSTKCAKVKSTITKDTIYYTLSKRGFLLDKQ